MLLASGRLSLVVATAALLMLPQPTAGTAPQGALGRYAHGDFAVIEDLPLDGIEAIRRDVKASTASPRVKAAFLLEAFETFQRRLQLDPRERQDPSERQFSAEDGKAQLNTLRAASGHVFQDAYDDLAALAAGDEFLSCWFRAAAAAFAHGAYGQSQVDWFWWYWGPDSVGAVDEFRFNAYVDPGELALTRALPLERFAWHSLYQDRQTFVTAQQEAYRQYTEKNHLPTVLGREKDAIPHAMAELKKAEAFDSARPEALMRQGAILDASGHPEEAISLFEKSERLTHDAWVSYLDGLLKGRAFERMDRVALAETSYRAAVALRPKARSANLALAALLFANGARADQNLLAVFDPASDRLDPWAQLTFGAYRFWPERRDAMRELLK